MGAALDYANQNFPDNNPDGSPFSPATSSIRGLAAAIENEIPNAQDLGAEAAARQAGDQSLTQAITAEQNARAAETVRAEGAEAALGAAITAEQNARAAETVRAEGAEAALGAAITAEQNARGVAITAEQNARAAAVTGIEANLADQLGIYQNGLRIAQAEVVALTASVTTEQQARVDDVAGVNAQVAQEVEDRTAGDAAAAAATDVVARAVTAEASQRDAADTALGSLIDGEAAARASAFVDFYALAALSGRPGDDPSRFTSDLAAFGSVLPSSYAPVQTAFGRTLRISGAGVLAPVALYAVEPGQTVKVRTVIQRVRDTADPAGDAVGLFIAWYTADRVLMATIARVAISALAVADGTRVFGALVSPDLGDASTVRPPVGAAYLRPFVQTWGETAVTDVAVLAAGAVADVLSPDLDALVGRVNAVEQRQVAELAAIRSRSFIRTVMFGG